jgi:hypothetical protein
MYACRIIYLAFRRTSFIILYKYVALQYHNITFFIEIRIPLSKEGLHAYCFVL